jgi:predicted nucleic acid-binding protein
LSVVVDASLMLACVLPDEKSDAAVATVAERLRAGEALVAPFHFPMELLSGIEQAARRGRVASDERFPIFAAAIEPGIELVTLPVAGNASVPPLVDLVDRSGLRAYDALYLQLAIARTLPLASLDEALRTAAAQEGIDVVPREPSPRGQRAPRARRAR